MQVHAAQALRVLGGQVLCSQQECSAVIGEATAADETNPAATARLVRWASASACQRTSSRRSPPAIATVTAIGMPSRKIKRLIRASVSIKTSIACPLTFHPLCCKSRAKKSIKRNFLDGEAQRGGDSQRKNEKLFASNPLRFLCASLRQRLFSMRRMLGFITAEEAYTDDPGQQRRGQNANR